MLYKSIKSSNFNPKLASKIITESIINVFTCENSVPIHVRIIAGFALKKVKAKSPKNSDFAFNKLMSAASNIQEPAMAKT